MKGEAWTPENACSWRKAGLGADETSSTVCAPGRRRPGPSAPPGHPDRPPSPAPAVSGPASLCPPPASRLYFSPSPRDVPPFLGSHDFVATRLKVFFRADLVPTFRACSPVPIGPLSRNLSVQCVSANICLVSALYFGRPSSPLGYYFVLVSTAAFCVRTIRE